MCWVRWCRQNSDSGALSHDWHGDQTGAGPPEMGLLRVPLPETMGTVPRVWVSGYRAWKGPCWGLWHLWVWGVH